MQILAGAPRGRRHSKFFQKKCFRVIHTFLTKFSMASAKFANLSRQNLLFHPIHSNIFVKKLTKSVAILNKVVQYF